jgi:hypothetical protein
MVIFIIPWPYIAKHIVLQVGFIVKFVAEVNIHCGGKLMQPGSKLGIIIGAVAIGLPVDPFVT